VGNFIYWIDGLEKAIYRAPRNSVTASAEIERVLDMRLESTFEAGDEGFPLNSELVTDGQYFFFAIDRALMRCDIDGGNPLIIQVPNVSFPELSSVNISTIATADGQVYWCDNNNEGIYRCDLDGGNPELF